jgi:hypothetical protein
MGNFKKGFKMKGKGKLKFAKPQTKKGLGQVKTSNTPRFGSSKLRPRT